MKKVSKFIILGLILIFIAGCSEEKKLAPLRTKIEVEEPKEVENKEIDLDKIDIYEIDEKLFITNVNNIYLNYEDYVGKHIKIEGLYMEIPDVDNTTYNIVARHGPACCVDDDIVGFQILNYETKPQINDWIEVIGTVETYDVNGYTAVYIKVTSLNIKEDHGLEYVEQ